MLNHRQKCLYSGASVSLGQQVTKAMPGLSLHVASAHTVLPSGQSGRSEVSVGSKRRWESAWGIPLLPLQSETPSQPGSQTAHLLQHWESGGRVNRGSSFRVQTSSSPMWQTTYRQDFRTMCRNHSWPFPNVLHTQMRGQSKERLWGVTKESGILTFCVCSPQRCRPLCTLYLRHNRWAQGSSFLLDWSAIPWDLPIPAHSMGVTQVSGHTHKSVHTRTWVLMLDQQTLPTELPFQLTAFLCNISIIFQTFIFLIFNSGMGSYMPILYSTHRITHSVC